MSGQPKIAEPVSSPAWPETGPAELGLPGVRVRTLAILRWIAIFGQTITLMVVAGYFGFPVPVHAVVLAIGALVVMNLGLAMLYRASAHLTGRQATLQLAFDLLQLAVLLYLTGGLLNPFLLLLLVPVTISATLLSLRSAVALWLLATACVTGLSFRALPLPWSGEAPQMPPVYLFGIWVAMVFGMAFLMAYAWQVSNEARKQQKALVATQSALAREQKMAALGSLAAAAAHELGGPLGTITLIASDLRRQLGDDPEFKDDISLLSQEAARSRDILVGIARRAEAEEAFPSVLLETLVREVAQPFEGSSTQIIVTRRSSAADVSPLQVARRPELMHGLSNFIANAVRHAATRVDLIIEETAQQVQITVRDDGPGFDPELLPQLGAPDLGPHRSGSGGTGLGIFIAITLLERIGARISFVNADNGGATVEISWPRSTLALVHSS